jgi:hypothetical protein
MKGIMIAGLALILIIAVPFTVLGESKGRGSNNGLGHAFGHWSGHAFGHWSGHWSGFAVSNPNHTQTLGSNSSHGCIGLSNAADHSPAVTPVTPPSTDGSSGDITGGTVGTVVPTGPGTL